jgi:hypothetical protein
MTGQRKETNLFAITKIPDINNVGMNDVHTVFQGSIGQVGTPKVTPMTLMERGNPSECS